ncbi:MAG: monovalent cation/H+ antiporter complex subunit F [Nitrososphaerota archaeon]|nr:monovalent cation/H+ antiporter complex subunit F [Nitrososphaerales archaeon]MCX8191328.1 monovalent cation/H+ antiporter complex subunit F [Nitrososphaerales archaeon]MDW8044492.1 monovalent cation/H+ antiporter complex subunit F [Nitrososphaerota archaeon]
MNTFILMITYALTIPIILATVRLFLGPTGPDRVVAADVISYSMIMVMIYFALITREYSLLDVTILLAILVFVGSLTVAKYLEGRGLGS